MISERELMVDTEEEVVLVVEDLVEEKVLELVVEEELHEKEVLLPQAPFLYCPNHHTHGQYIYYFHFYFCYEPYINKDMKVISKY